MKRTARVFRNRHGKERVKRNSPDSGRDQGAGQVKRKRPARHKTLPDAVLGLQRTIGNKATAALLEDEGQAFVENRTPEAGGPAKPSARSSTDSSVMAQIEEGTPSAPGARPTLYPGSSGPDVELLQNKLRAAKRFVPVTGIFDAQTRTAVVDFQESMRLEADGVVGRRTWEALDAVSRGQALTEADEAELVAKAGAANALFAAEEFKGALAGYMDIYGDPRYATKPSLLEFAVFNTASCHHHLAFEPGLEEAEKKGELNEAISWYQEFSAREDLSPDVIANAATRIREARLGQPPTSVGELQKQKEAMG